MKKVSVRTLAGHPYAVQVEDGRHAFIADEAVADGGEDAGASPYELLLAALGSCTAITVVMYARRHDWPLDAVSVDLTHDKVDAAACDDCTEEERLAAGPHGRIDRIEMRIALRGGLSQEQRGRLLEIAGRCPVHRTLERPPKIVTRGVEAG